MNDVEPEKIQLLVDKLSESLRGVSYAVGLNALSIVLGAVMGSAVKDEGASKNEVFTTTLGHVKDIAEDYLKGSVAANTSVIM